MLARLTSCLTLSLAFRAGVVAVRADNQIVPKSRQSQSFDGALETWGSRLLSNSRVSLVLSQDLTLLMETDMTRVTEPQDGIITSSNIISKYYFHTNQLSIPKQQRRLCPRITMATAIQPRFVRCENIGFFSALSAIKPNSLEEPVQMLWNVLLPSFFPGPEGYKIGIKAAVLMDNSAPNVVVFQIQSTTLSPRSSGQLLERQIFMIECKRPSMDTPGEWQSTVNGQLRHYLENNLNRENEMYAATAIGTKVKFYRWHGVATGCLEELHQEVFDLTDIGHQQCVEQWLWYIKESCMGVE